MAKQLKAIKCPTDELAATNCAIVNPREFEKVRLESFSFDLLHGYFFVNF
jgi:hypothetical protein